MSRTRPLTRLTGAPSIFLGGLLAEEHAEFERKRIEAAGKHDPGAAGSRGGLVGVDHLPHPDRLAAEVEIVGAGGRAGRDQLGAVELIGPDGRQHRGWSARPWPSAKPDRRRRRRSGRCRRARRSRRARRRVFPGCARPSPISDAPAAIMRREIFGDQLPGEAGGAIDDDVEFRRRLHDQIPWK